MASSPCPSYSMWLYFTHDPLFSVPTRRLLFLLHLYVLLRNKLVFALADNTLSVQNIKNTFLILTCTPPKGCWPMLTPMLPTIVSSWLDIFLVADHSWYTQETVEREKPSSMQFLTQPAVVPTVTIKTYPNQKPWIDVNICAKLNAWTIIFNHGKVTGNMAEYKQCSYSLQGNQTS